MGSFSDYTERNVLESIFKIKTFAQGTNLLVALSTTDPTDSGVNINEPGASAGYVRVVYNSWSYDIPTNTISNTAEVIFPVTTDDWGFVKHFAVFDDEATPNMIAYGAVASPQIIPSGNIAIFPAGSLTITLD